MKSIIEEASSIVKAIEAAWIRAEKPHEFSVKIFEEPEKNFFGMVTKSAKIALIFKNLEKKSSYKDQPAPSKHKPASEQVFTTHSTKESTRKEYTRPEPITVREPVAREHREPRESREYRERENREYRENREPREYRDTREPREPRERENREHRENREPREYREPREPREPRERENREYRENREPRENREAREPRENREPREYREPMVREIARKEQLRNPEFAPRKESRNAAPTREREKERDVTSMMPKEREINPDQEGKEKIFWTEEMIETTRAWIDTLLKNLNRDDITFTLEPKRYYLTISFDKPVRDTKPMEQQLFRSCAYLIMQMLRTKLKKQFRGLKVVLHTQE